MDADNVDRGWWSQQEYHMLACSKMRPETVAEQSKVEFVIRAHQRGDDVRTCSTARTDDLIWQHILNCGQLRNELKRHTNVELNEEIAKLVNNDIDAFHWSNLHWKMVPCQYRLKYPNDAGTGPFQLLMFQYLKCSRSFQHCLNTWNNIRMAPFCSEGNLAGKNQRDSGKVRRAVCPTQDTERSSRTLAIRHVARAILIVIPRRNIWRHLCGCCSRGFRSKIKESILLMTSSIIMGKNSDSIELGPYRANCSHQHQKHKNLSGRKIHRTISRNGGRRVDHWKYCDTLYRCFVRFWSEKLFPSLSGWLWRLLDEIEQPLLCSFMRP